MRAIDCVPDPQSDVLRKVGNQIPMHGAVQGNVAEAKLGLCPRKPHVRGFSPKVRQFGFCHHEKNHDKKISLLDNTSGLLNSIN